MKSKIVKIVTWIVFFATFLASVYISSKDNLKNRDEGLASKTIETEEVFGSGWTVEKKNVFTSTSCNSYLQITDLPEKLSSVRISGYFYNECPTDVRMVCNLGNGYYPTNSCRVPCYSVGNRIYFQIDKIDQSDMREAFASGDVEGIRLYPDDNTYISVRAYDIVLNDNSLVFDFYKVAKFCLLPTVGVLLLLLVAFYWRELLGSIHRFSRYTPLVDNLVSRDLKVKYRRSVLGFLWSILNPLLMALVINAVFSRLFRFDVEYFASYYLCGALIFNFMTEATTASMTSVLDSAGLIKKVYIPKYIFCFQKCVFAFVNMLFAGVAVVVVMLIQGCPFHPTMFLFLIPMVYVFIFALGVGLILASVTVFFRDVLHLYSVFTLIWMYLTPIIYPESLLQENGIGFVLSLNPMYYYTHMFREVMLYNTLPTLIEHVMGLLFAFGFLIIGVITFKKSQDKFILYI